MKEERGQFKATCIWAALIFFNYFFLNAFMQFCLHKEDIMNLRLRTIDRIRSGCSKRKFLIVIVLGHHWHFFNSTVFCRKHIEASPSPPRNTTDSMTLQMWGGGRGGSLLFSLKKSALSSECTPSWIVDLMGFLWCHHITCSASVWPVLRCEVSAESNEWTDPLNTKQKIK